MLMFCPTCANILQVDEGNHSQLRFSCSTCPYVHNIAKRIGSRTYPKLKEVLITNSFWKSSFKSLRHPPFPELP